jgi:hypothetical protein
LGNDTRWRKSKAWKVFDRRVGQYQPLPLGDHVDKFVLKKGYVVVAGLMRAAMEGVHDLLTSPGRSSELDRRASVLVESQQTTGRVLDMFQRRKITTGAALGNKTAPSKCIKQFYITGNELT